MAARRHNSEKARQRAKRVYLLSRLVFCGCWGAAYIGNLTTARNNHYPYYECGARERVKTCSNRRIRKEELEDEVLEQIGKSILALESKAAFIDKIVDFCAKQRDEVRQEEAYLKKKYGSVKKALENLLRAVEQGSAPGLLLEQLAAREREALAIKNELDRPRFREEVTLSREDIKRYLDGIFQQFEDKKSEEHLKPLVRQFVEKVIVFEDRVEVVLKIVLDTGGVGGLTLLYPLTSR